MRSRRRRPLGGGLILARDVEQQVVIDLPHGGRLVITPIECGNGRVKLHFEAPRDVRIRREEVADRDLGSGARDQNEPPAAESRALKLSRSFHARLNPAKSFHLA